MLQYVRLIAMKPFVVSLLLASALFGAHQTIDPAKGLVLANNHVRLEFAPENMGLVAMVDLATGRNHIPPIASGVKPRLWELTIGRGATSRAMDNSYRVCSLARVETLPGRVRRAVMEWNGMRWWLEDNAFTVRVTIDLPPDSGIAQWRIFVENNSDYWGLRSVAFPVVAGFPAAGAYDIARPVFASGGHLLKQWSDPVQGRHPSGGWPMQFFSLHSGKDSVYAGTRDADGRAKDFGAEPGKQFSVIHYPENLTEAGSGWPDFYPVEFGVFQGSWVDAARHYREWALRQKWAAAGKLSGRSLSQLILNASFWVCESWLWKDPPSSPARSADMNEWVREKTKAAEKADPRELNLPLFEAQERMGVPAALHWYNWHQTDFDHQYPHFFPAKPGAAERVRDLVSRGVLVMPYINGCSADMNIPDWDKFAPYAIRDEAGGLRHHFYSDAAGRLLTMCPTQAFWQGTVARLVDRLVSELGVNGVYVDQVSAMEHELCFNRAHGHPLGGGRYWTDGNRELLRKVRHVAERASRRVTITSEGADEMFLDLVDANLTWAQPADYEIPLMQIVYSGYTILFGSPVDFTQSDRLFRYAQGQALIDGRQNGWMSLRLFDDRHEAKIRYLKECARTRARFGRYLTYGRLLEPITPLSCVPSFTEDVFGWNDKHRGSAPVAEGRLYQAEDGRLAVCRANYGDQPVSFRYRVDPRRFGGSGIAFERTDLLEAASVNVFELPAITESTSKAAGTAREMRPAATRR